MKWLGIIWLLVLAFASAPASAATNGPVCVIVIREDITHNTLFLVRRGLQEAAAKKAVAVVLDMDTNGGAVKETEKIIRLLEKSPAPTITFINPKGYSAGAFISAATDKIYMSPGSVIGAATPVMLTPGSGPAELPKSYEEKLSSAMRALIRSTAQTKGHNPDVFEAMVDADRGLTVDDKVIAEKGKLVTLTNEEAARTYGDPPRPLLSLGTVRDLDELLERLDLAGAETFTVVPTGLEVVGRWITMISPLLMLVGFLAIYLEFKTPGIGLPALIAVICFSIYFVGNFIAGLAGMEEVIIFAIGITLLAVEIFVLPGFGIAGFLGIAAILIALVLGMTERVPTGFAAPAWTDLQLPIITVVGSFVGSVFAMLLLGRFLPQTPLFRKMELAATLPHEPDDTAPAPALLHATGVAETMLRPSGKGRFGEQLVDIMTTGDLIERGTAIKIVAIHGSRVVVERIS